MKHQPSENPQAWISYDQQHVWHPYSAIGSDLPIYPVLSASGVRLQLADGRELIDGMSSWWCAIHGYNHPQMNRALELSLIHISEPTRQYCQSRMPSDA